MSNKFNNQYPRRQTSGDAAELNQVLGQDTVDAGAPVANEPAAESTETVSVLVGTISQNLAPNFDPPKKEVATPVPAPAAAVQKAPVSPEILRAVKALEMELVSYHEAMLPKKPIVPETGGIWQASLYATLTRVLDVADPESFKEQWRAILGYFHKYRGELFNSENMYRFASTWRGSPRDFKTYRQLVFLLIETADPKTRQANVRSIVLDRITIGLKPQGVVNLLNFYA